MIPHIAALLGPAAVIAATPFVVVPPPMTIPPGPPPLTNEVSGRSSQRARIIGEGRAQSPGKRIQKVRRHNVGFLQTRNLRARRLRDQREDPKRNEAIAVIDGVAGRKGPEASAIIVLNVAKSSSIDCLGLL